MPPAFHETTLGREFFTHHFPELVETLKELVNVLKGDKIVISSSLAEDIVHFIKNLQLEQSSPLYTQSEIIFNFFKHKLDKK